jgi:RNA polymerase sigma-70 factor (ECF subfamily)
MVSDEALFEALLRGDLGAFDRLYARHERPLFGFICRQVGDRGAAEDVLHETFLALLSGRASRPEHFRAWLYQVARHHCLRRLRDVSRERSAKATEGRLPPEGPALPELALVEHERRAALQVAVGALPPPLGELYALRASGLSYEEMAQVLEVPLGTIKSRMHQLVKTLQEAMTS